ncbi:MAG TPA: GerMN domain-containing protein [Candidatus Sulfotelmatobacter sp.]|nr:GerMN domain-containing protein [Candidatus Sulfotelmatobacter sp.]
MIPRHLQIAIGVLLFAALSLTFYAWHVRKTVTMAPAVPPDTRPLAPPVTGPTERVALYVAHDDDNTVRAQEAQIPMPSGRQQRAEELLRALISLYLEKNSPHTIGAGSEVRSVYLIDPGEAVIDMNGAFADTHRSGVLVEELTIASLIHTLTANTPNVLKVKILIDGKERDTLAGHADLSAFYDVAAVDQLTSQLQAQ